MGLIFILLLSALGAASTSKNAPTGRILRSAYRLVGGRVDLQWPCRVWVSSIVYTGMCV
jgi:hypothetical protein